MFPIPIYSYSSHVHSYYGPCSLHNAQLFSIKYIDFDCEAPNAIKMTTGAPSASAKAAFCSSFVALAELGQSWLIAYCSGKLNILRSVTSTVRR